MTYAPTANVSREDWEATPAPVQRMVTQLLLAVSQLQAQLVVLRADHERLTARVAELEEKQRTNSGNSSKPPSSDPPSTPPRSRPMAKREKGGQRGHKGNHRALLSLDQVNAVVICKPTVCVACVAPLAGTDPEPSRHQVHDLAPKLVLTTEYQLHRLVCQCGHHTRATLPDGVGLSPFGPSIQAFQVHDVRSPFTT